MLQDWTLTTATWMLYFPLKKEIQPTEMLMFLSEIRTRFIHMGDQNFPINGQMQECGVCLEYL